MYMYTYIYMATKTISIMEDAYEVLARKKYKNESFSDVIRRIFKKKRDIMKLAGTLNITDEEAIEMKKNIEIMGEHATKDLLKKIKNDMH